MAEVAPLVRKMDEPLLWHWQQHMIVVSSTYTCLEVDRLMHASHEDAMSKSGMNEFGPCYENAMGLSSHVSRMSDGHRVCFWLC